MDVLAVDILRSSAKDAPWRHPTSLHPKPQIGIEPMRRRLAGGGRARSSNVKLKRHIGSYGVSRPPRRP